MESQENLVVGVLALQGDFQAHARMLRECGVEALEVRDEKSLSACDALIIPGGESTTMSRLCDRYGLWEPLRTRLENGMPTLGTCAGLIMLSRELRGATRNFIQSTLGALDVDVARNAYGAQVDSFETDINVPAFAAADLGGEPLRAVFIRAPRIERVGNGVEVLAHHNGEPVVVRQGATMGVAFHPEIAADIRLHRLWLQNLDKESDFVMAAAKVEGDNAP